MVYFFYNEHFYKKLKKTQKNQQPIQSIKKFRVILESKIVRVNYLKLQKISELE